LLLIRVKSHACRGQFSDGQGFQFNQRTPPCQAVHHVLHERKLLRAGKDILPHGVAVPVNHDLEMTEQFRRVLHFIYQEWSGIPA
jgi:hypothetical protein